MDQEDGEHESRLGELPTEPRREAETSINGMFPGCLRVI